MPKKVLVLCTGNSCRSQMAEGLWNELAGGDWQAVSAGSKPAGYVHPMAVQAMSELGLDLTSNTSKHLDEFAEESFDAVVTVCDSAREACPAFPGSPSTLHWPFEDPAYATGSDEQRLAIFRKVRDQIRETISNYLAEA